MFAKIGQAVSDIGAAKQKKKDATGLSDDAYFKKYGEKRPGSGSASEQFKQYIT